MVSNFVYEKALSDKNNVFIMHKAASKFLNRLNKDEMLECKLIGLWNALKYWKCEKTVKFTTFLYKQVQWECLRLINDKNNNKMFTVEGVDRETYGNTSVEEVLECLPKNLRELTKKRYVENMTLSELSRYYNCCHETIRKRIQKIKFCLKTQFFTENVV
jgi:DNA-directed RNA polymerase specialized sigma24 family protein